MDLLQEEQSGGGRLPLTVLTFSFNKHVQHIRRQYAGTEGVHLLEEARPEWELTGSDFLQRKSKQASRM